MQTGIGDDASGPLTLCFSLQWRRGGEAVAGWDVETFSRRDDNCVAI